MHSRDLLVSTSHHTTVWITSTRQTTLPAFYVGSGDLNPGPQVCKASSSLPELSAVFVFFSLSLNHHWLYSYRVHHHHSPCRAIRPLITPPLPYRRWPSTLSFQATEATVGKPSSPTLARHTTQGVLTASEGRTRRWMHAFILAGGVAHSPPHLGPEEVRQYRQVWLWKA